MKVAKIGLNRCSLPGHWRQWSVRESPDRKKKQQKNTVFGFTLMFLLLHLLPKMIHMRLIGDSSCEWCCVRVCLRFSTSEIDPSWPWSETMALKMRWVDLMGWRLEMNEEDVKRGRNSGRKWEWGKGKRTCKSRFPSCGHNWSSATT